MKLLSLEKYLLKNDINDEEFKKLVIEISEKLELEALSEGRKLTDEEIDFAKKLFSRYSKVKGNEKVILNNSGNLEEVDVVDLEKLDEEIKKYQQL